MNPFLAPGHMTSGRRTYKGNRLVGGVADSHHLDGSAGDYTGTSADALRQFFGASAHIIPESDHLHVQGLPPGTFPYFGNQGTAGRVNGVDTSSPRGMASVAPRKKPMSLASIAQPDLNQMAPVGLDAQQMQPQPASLASLMGGQGNIPAKSPSKFTAGNIMGVLGDALMAYGGMTPTFGPHLAKQQDEAQQTAFDREKLNAELQQRREEALLKAQEPPQYVQNAQAWSAMGPEQRRMVLQQQDAVNPVNVSTPQGTQNVPRTTVKTINGKTYYSIGGEWYEETQ